MDYLLAFGGAIVANAPSLVGFAMPLIVEYLNTDVHDETIRRNIAIASCFLMAVILHWNSIADGQPQQVVLFAALTIAESQVIFKLYFRKSVARDVVQKLYGTKWVEESADTEALPTAAIAPQQVEVQ